MDKLIWIDWLLIVTLVCGIALVVWGLVTRFLEWYQFKTEGINGVYLFSARLYVADETLRLVILGLLGWSVVYFTKATIERIGPMPHNGVMARVYVEAVIFLIAAKSGLNRYGAHHIRVLDEKRDRRKEDTHENSNLRITDNTVVGSHGGIQFGANHGDPPAAC